MNTPAQQQSQTRWLLREQAGPCASGRRALQRRRATKREAAGATKTTLRRRDTAAAGSARLRGSRRRRGCGRGRVDGRLGGLRARDALEQPQLSPRTLTVRLQLPVFQTMRRVMLIAQDIAKQSRKGEPDCRYKQVREQAGGGPRRSRGDA